MTQRVELIAQQNDRRKRLEDALFERFPGLSRMYLRDVVRDGKCEVNGRHENVGYKLRPGDFIELFVDLERETAMRPEPLPLNVLFEDEWLLIVDKPSGMLVHPTHREKNGTLLNGLAYYLNSNRNSLGPVLRPGLVHRLDKGTSGLMLIAKDVRTHRSLARAFQKRQVEKRYTALVNGELEDDTGSIEAPIGRYGEKKFWGVKEGGKPSVSNYRVIHRLPGRTGIELEPVTGRTNQLRIHCAFIGHPIIGDVERGGPPHDRMCLHASRLSFRHPQSGVWESYRSSSDFLAS